MSDGLSDGTHPIGGGWLSGRRQRVVIEGVASGWELVLSGVVNVKDTIFWLSPTIESCN